MLKSAVSVVLVILATALGFFVGVWLVGKTITSVQEIGGIPIDGLSAEQIQALFATKGELRTWTTVHVLGTWTVAGSWPMWVAVLGTPMAFFFASLSAVRKIRKR